MRETLCESPATSGSPDLPFTPSSSADSFSSSIATTHRTRLSEPCVLSWSMIRFHGESGCSITVRLQCSRKSSSVRVGPTVGEIDSPVTTSKLAIRHNVPWRMYANSIRSC